MAKNHQIAGASKAFTKILRTIGRVKEDILTLLRLLLWVPLLPVYLLVAVVLYILSLPNRTYDVPAATRDSVIIITGCDSGIGKASALELVKRGYHVVATVFTDIGAEQLKTEAENHKGEVTCFFTDITKDDSVDELHEGVVSLFESNKTKRLVGLVNNAGIALPGLLELQPLSQFQRQIDVNLTGHVRVTQRFLPLIRKSKGRIVNICSIAGRIACSMMGAYDASKFGMEAISDTLRDEMSRFGVSVSAVEPGFIKTPLVENVGGGRQHQIWDSMNDLSKHDYEYEHQKFISMADKLTLFAGKAEDVAASVTHGLLSPYPKTRYLVGTDAKLLAFVVWGFGDRLRDVILRINQHFQ